ncbi:hypothetical protein [Streptomyces sp. Isolate_219]|uniref:hypothetical protein n=1 Tax=Streptomyces sp. Isolate_219 TaxID=2950110 RepID=UPI0021C90287|nr:hypothetical protein [Streptomyces sp. Isolate_219]MCR8575595.1 hypothetical protein [Streptomyces sp. Isolate_219]
MRTRIRLTGVAIGAAMLTGATAAAAAAQAAPAHSETATPSTATSSSTATGWDPILYPSRLACQAAGEKSGEQWTCVRLQASGEWRLYIYS